MSQNQDPIHLARQFEIIFTTHYSAVKYFAINLLKSEEDAEDIIQDVFAKLWTQPEVWLENKDIGQYIYAMTKNTTFNFIKRKRLEQSYQEQLSQKYLIEDLLKSEDTLDPIYYKEALLIIRLILDRLPERRRKVFEMSRINNMSNMEIAQALNISVRTVEHQIYLTLLEIKKLIFLPYFIISHLRRSVIHLCTFQRYLNTTKIRICPRKSSRKTIFLILIPNHSRNTPPKKTRNQLPFLIVGFSSLIMVLT